MTRQKKKKVVDLIAQQDEVKARRCTFVLSPKRWTAYRNTAIKSWNFRRLRTVDKGYVPASSGIYTLLVQPEVARHDECSYLMYVGKAESLKRRFGEYLNAEQLSSGRPKIFHLLNVYEGYVWFGFTNVGSAQLRTVENALITAHLPPCNDRLPARLAKSVKAF